MEGERKAGRVEAGQETCVPGSCVPKICEPKGWHSRGYLPHFDSTHHIQHVTLHLADSLPKDVLERLDESLRLLPDAEQKLERVQRLQELIDAGYGSCVFNEPEPAEMMQQTLQHFDGERYELHAWVIMPNHVHVLLQTKGDWELSKVVASWKKFSARRINDWKRAVEATRESCVPKSCVPGNAALPSCHSPAPVWHSEYWDRYIRNDNHYHQVLEYIHNNPVKAGLCENPKLWPWSSLAK